MDARVCCLLLLVLATGAQAVNPADRDGLEEKSLTVNAQTRTYLYHVPRSHDLKSEMPLLLVFHGGERGGRKMSRLSHFNRLADAQRFIVVYPVGMNHHWNDTRNLSTADDVKFVRVLIAELEQAHKIDHHRIYATGFSNGGFFSIRLACEMSDTIAAAVSVSATMPEKLRGQCKLRERFPSCSCMARRLLQVGSGLGLALHLACAFQPYRPCGAL